MVTEVCARVQRENGENMKKFINSFLSILIALSFCNINIFANENIENDEIIDLNEDKKIISDIQIDEHLRTVIISNGEGVFTLELYCDDVLIKSETKNLYEKNANSIINFANYDGEFYESNSGWGIFIPNKYDFAAFTCPIEYVEEGEVSNRYFEIQKGIDDNYVNQFKLRLKDYILLEEELHDGVYDYVFDAAIAAIKFAGAFYFSQPALAYDAAMDMILEINSAFALGDLVNEMTELQDEMAFFYIELFRYRN